jgi:hypothetical protein
MNKSAKSPLWLRLLPVIFFISIIVICLIYGFKEFFGDDTDANMYFIGVIAVFIFTSIILSTIIILFPFAGGILSLLLLLICVLNIPDIEFIFIYVFSMLFFGGIKGIFVGIWNFRYRRHSKSSVNPQNGTQNKT